ncbi:porin [Polaromonas sp. YR568]|uniref:porin n=1 Tax=Polaromonas sp. YR568 TaxID=1855301 RepID=UPI003137869A
MKKTLIAFAALSAIAGVAQAQSSVTLYGLVDAFVGRTTSQVGAAAKLSQTVVNGSGQNNSRWGLRGSEDLGGGMKAIFTLEGGFQPDNGTNATISAQGGGLFGRAAFVGIEGGFGTVTLGRVYSAYDDLRGATNMIYDSNFATTGTVYGTGLRDYQNRSSNAIRYVSPTVSGFSGAISYGMGENKTATASAEKVTALHIKYVNGPLFVGYAYQNEKQVNGGSYFGTNATLGTAATALTFDSNRKYHALGASYDFGVAKLTGSYNTSKGETAANTSASDKGYQLGVSVPFGAAAVAVGYSREKSDATNNNNRGKGMSILGTYALSKRTNLYAGYLSTKVQSTNGTSETKATTLGTGIKHTF